MITEVPTLDAYEHGAVVHLVRRALRDAPVPLVAAVLFGSKARGDFDADSDVDVLLIFDADPDGAAALGDRVAAEADAIVARTGVSVEPWAVSAADLEPGRRTPMLVDALDDGRPLWPPGRPPLRIAFTPADAVFCAACLLEWVAEGGPVARRALADERLVDAAGRARDDTTRLAAAALLLTGDTRHRRAGSLLRFHERFVVGGDVSPSVGPAVDWALRAFPSDGGRGRDTPPVPHAAARSARRGVALAARMETHVVPWITARMETLTGRSRATPNSSRTAVDPVAAGA